jgi:hypothetical protein
LQDEPEGKQPEERRSMFTQQEKNMLSAFITEYIHEKRLLISTGTP